MAHELPQATSNRVLIAITIDSQEIMAEAADFCATHIRQQARGPQWDNPQFFDNIIGEMLEGLELTQDTSAQITAANGNTFCGAMLAHALHTPTFQKFIKKFFNKSISKIAKKIDSNEAAD